MTIKELWNLQEKRIEHENVKVEYNNSPVLVEIKELKIKLTETENDFEAVEEQKKEVDKKVRKSNIEQLELEENEKRIKDKLYNGEISNPKELSGLQEKLVGIKEEKGKKEDNYLELSILQEDLDEKKEMLSSSLKELKLEYAAKNANLQSYKEECQNKLNKIVKDYNKLKEKIEPDLLKKYSRLYKRFGNTAISKITGNRCSGCHMKLSISEQDIVKKDDFLGKCESCGRMLYKGE